jgi:type I restriction enzyme, S subunit
MESIKYIQHYMAGKLAERIRVEVNAGNTPYITRGTLTEMKIAIPPTKDEQDEIANILSDLEKEIDELESKSNKTRQIKQGMMQELLTGRIRLV